MGPPAARPKHGNPFLAAPTWEDTPRPAMQAAEAAAAPDISLLEQGDVQLDMAVLCDRLKHQLHSTPLHGNPLCTD